MTDTAKTQQTMMTQESSRFLTSMRWQRTFAAGWKTKTSFMQHLSSCARTRLGTRARCIWNFINFYYLTTPLICKDTHTHTHSESKRDGGGACGYYHGCSSDDLKQSVWFSLGQLHNLMIAWTCKTTQA